MADQSPHPKLSLSMITDHLRRSGVASGALDYAINRFVDYDKDDIDPEHRAHDYWGNWSRYRWILSAGEALSQVGAMRRQEQLAHVIYRQPVGALEVGLDFWPLVVRRHGTCVRPMTVGVQASHRMDSNRARYPDQLILTDMDEYSKTPVVHLHNLTVAIMLALHHRWYELPEFKIEVLVGVPLAGSIEKGFYFTEDQFQVTGSAVLKGKLVPGVKRKRDADDDDAAGSGEVTPVVLPKA